MAAENIEGEMKNGKRGGGVIGEASNNQSMAWRKYQRENVSGGVAANRK
jgi:hypothetical protein